jgi:hypothetical protein
MTHPIDRPAISAESVDRLLAVAGKTLPDRDPQDPAGEFTGGHDREGLRADLESIRSLYFTSPEVRSSQCRQEVARALTAAKSLRSLIETLDIRYVRFRRHIDSLIAELEGDISPTVIRLLDIHRGMSAFDNVVHLLAVQWRHYFDQEPGYTLDMYREEIRSPFIDFAEAALIEMGINKDDGAPYARASIVAALKKTRKG